MKKLILMITLIGLSAFLYAQNSFPTNNAKWNVLTIWDNAYGYYSIWEHRVRTNIFSLEGEVTFDDVPYSKLLYNQDFCGGIREESQKVWFKMGNGGEEYLLYDFGASVGDTVWHYLAISDEGPDCLPFDDFAYSVIEQITVIDGVKHLYTYAKGTNGWNDATWIEGIGSTAGPFGHLPMWRCVCEDRYRFSLACFMHHDVIEYFNDSYCDSCFDCQYWERLGKDDIYIGSVYGERFYYEGEPIQAPLWVSIMPPYKGKSPYTYLWSTDSESSVFDNPTIYNPTLTFSSDVTVYVKVTDRLGDNAYDTLTLIVKPSQLPSDDFSNNITLYPNPVKDVLYMEMPENVKMKSVNIYDIKGKLVEENRYSFGIGQLNISPLKKGPYIISVETDKGSFNKVIIKK